jgi:OOP family OmpA-OmpF porin
LADFRPFPDERYLVAMRRILILFGLCICVSPTFAQDSGIYLGGAFGGRGYDNACEPQATSCDRRGGAWSGYAGWRFHQRFGVEVSYLDLGNARASYPRVTSILDVTGHIEGYDLSALFNIPAGEDVWFFLRAGGFRWQARTRSDEFAFDEEDWSATAGAGFEWRAGRRWQFRGQYQYLNDIGGEETGRANGHVVTFGASYIFTRR